MKSPATGNKQLAICLCVLLVWCTYPCAQPLALPNAYAHNDYWHKRPVFDALNNGFTYMEADIFLRKNRLVVAHRLLLAPKSKTLESLYLKPIADYINSKPKLSQSAMDTLVLMIDIKSDAEPTYNYLKQILEKYRSILSSVEDGRMVQRNLTIVLTGNRPLTIIENEKRRLVFIDKNLQSVNNGEVSSNLYTIASCKYSRLIKWKGKGTISINEKKRLCDLVANAHSYGSKVRLWASPEKEKVWRELLNCGVDLINTDKLSTLRNFFIKDASLLATSNSGGGFNLLLLN